MEQQWNGTKQKSVDMILKKMRGWLLMWQVYTLPWLWTLLCPMENTELDNYPRRREPLWESRFPKNEFQTGAKIVRLDALKFLVKTGRVVCYFKYKDNNTKV